MKRRYFVIALVVLAALVTAIARKGTVTGGWEENSDSLQLKFSHKGHIKDAGVGCEECHKAAKTSKLSSDNLRPNHDNCITCHEEQVNNTCGYCHKNPDNIEAAPPRVRSLIFSHEKHTSMKDVECVACHKGLEEVEYAGPKNMPSMETCSICHNDAKATNTCEACHTSFTNLIPPDHLKADFKREHRKMTRLGALDVSCATCHTQTFCADCHAAAGLVGIGTRDLMADPAPRGSRTESPNQLQLQMAHNLNYRFTHGIDAKSKSSECYTCHSPQEFCVRCHNTGGNITASSFKPAWHLGSDFARIGVGSGGGRHAELARRDIESCVSCHDVRGADPTCVTCHTDGDGIRGTNPRTHPGGFQKGQEGSWHSDPGATCYSCHTDVNAYPGGKRGMGFCGYCHQ